MAKIQLKDLLEAGCHFGHQPKRWNPKMKPYLYMARSGVHIFDLVKTKEGLEEAIKEIENIVSKGGEVIFVGTKRQAQSIVKSYATKVNAPYINTRWLGGLFTNWSQVSKSIKKLKDLKEKRAIGKFEKYTKKEQLLIARKINKLEKFLGGLINLTSIPEAIFVVDTNREQGAVAEAKQVKAKVIGMVDSNADPDMVDIVIPGNDDAVNAIQFIVSHVADAYERGKVNFSKSVAKAKAKAKDEESKKDTKN